jgi:hypothetical protein
MRLAALRQTELDGASNRHCAFELLVETEERAFRRNAELFDQLRKERAGARRGRDVEHFSIAEAEFLEPPHVFTRDRRRIACDLARELHRFRLNGGQVSGRFASRHCLHTLARSARFGADQVFIDHYDRAPCQDFPSTIESSLARADVVLALIGPRWIAARDAQGRQRLAQADCVASCWPRSTPAG